MFPILNPANNTWKEFFNQSIPFRGEMDVLEGFVSFSKSSHLDTVIKFGIDFNGVDGERKGLVQKYLPVHFILGTIQ